jgi:hypothetical protein
MKKYPKQNARAHTHTHTHTKHKKNHKTPKSQRNTKTNHIQATQQRAPHQHEQQCIISHKKEAHNRKRVPRKKGEKTSPRPRKEKTKVGNR